MGYTGKILTVIPNGIACSIHYHIKKCETFYITRGTLILQLFELLPGFNPHKFKPFTQRALPPLDTIVREVMRIGLHARGYHIPSFVPHRFWAGCNEVAEFIEVSTPDDPADSYRLVESGPIPK